jgi:hypothetical protein
MKTIRPIYPFGPAVGKWKSQGTVAETFARIRQQLAQQPREGNEVGFPQLETKQPKGRRSYPNGVKRRYLGQSATRAGLRTVMVATH